MTTQKQHLVYVIYYDGKPIDAAGGRVAYWSEGTARAAVTGRIRNAIGRADGEEVKARAHALMERYEIIPYGRLAE